MRCGCCGDPACNGSCCHGGRSRLVAVQPCAAFAEAMAAGTRGLGCPEASGQSIQ